MEGTAHLTKALKILDSKKENLERLNSVIRNINSQKEGAPISNTHLMICDVYGRVPAYVTGSMLAELVPAEMVLRNAASAVKVLEEQINELTVMLNNFGKAMEPILKEQDQC